MNAKIIKLDINKKLYQRITAKQRDVKSRYLFFYLLDGAIPFNLTNRSVRVYAKKPDGTEIFNDLQIVDAAKGICKLELTTQILAVDGIVPMELMVTEGLSKLTSNIFELEVGKSINSETAIVSTNEFTALVNGLASLSEYDSYKNELKLSRGSAVSVPARLDGIDSQMAENVQQMNFDSINVLFPPKPLLPAFNDGVNDDTVRIQAIIDYAYANKIEKVLLGNIHLINGTIYINQDKPMFIIGMCENNRFREAGIENPNTTIIKNTNGDVFRVNLDSQGNSVLLPTLQLFNITFEGINFKSQNKSAVTAIKLFRTRCKFENLSSSNIDYLIQYPNNDSNSNDNYGDMCILRNIRIMNSNKGGIQLYRADSSSINNYYFENPNIACVEGLKVKLSGCVSITNTVFSMLSKLDTTNKGTLVNIENSNGINVKNIYIEESKMQDIIRMFYSENISIENLHSRFFNRNMFHIINSKNISINNIEGWSDIESGYHDFHFEGSDSDNFNINYKNIILKNYTNGNERFVTFNDKFLVTNFMSEDVRCHIYYNNGWKIEDYKGKDLTQLLKTSVVWEGDKITFNGKFSKAATAIVSSHATWNLKSHDVQVLDYDPLYIRFYNGDTVVNTQDSKMNFDLTITLLQ